MFYLFLVKSEALGVNNVRFYRWLVLQLWIMDPSRMHLTTCCSKHDVVMWFLPSFCIEWGYWSKLYEILSIITSAIMDLWIGPPGMHLTTCCSLPDVKKWEGNLVLLCSEATGVTNGRFYWFLTPNRIKQVGTISLEFPLNFHIQGTRFSVQPLMLS